MKIQDLFKRIFKSNEVVLPASIRDFVCLPLREELSSEKQQKLDEYKNRYLEILKTKRTITSIDLNVSALRDNLEMYMRFLLSMLEQEEDKLVSFEKINKNQEESKELENQIKMGKLKLYFYRIVSIEDETTLRAVALLEILKEKLILSPNKKRSIKEEINNLASNLLSFKNQRAAINHEIERYLIESGFIEEERSPENAIEEKYKELCKIFEVLGLDSSSYKDLSATNIIFMEEEIEKYTYHHPEGIEELRIKVQKLRVKYYTRFVHKDYNQESVLKEIEEIEYKYKIYNDYGRKLVSYEEIETFYRLKFGVLTSDIKTNVKFNITNDITYTELEIYIKIIEEKIQDLVMGTNPNILNIGIPVRELLPLIIEILKNGEREFLTWDILNDRKRLALLLSFDVEFGLRYFFRLLDTGNNYKMVDFQQHFLKWEEIIPLSSIYWMMDYDIKCNDLYTHYDSKIERLYLKLYQMYKEVYLKEEGIFRFPEGITIMNFYNQIKLTELLNEEMEGKDIYTPSTLKTFRAFPFESKESILASSLQEHSKLQAMKIKNMYLNEGLEVFDYKMFYNFYPVKGNSLYLSSTLKDEVNFYSVQEHFKIVYLYEHQLSFDWVRKAECPFILLDTDETSIYMPENFSGRKLISDWSFLSSMNFKNVYIDYFSDGHKMLDLIADIFELFYKREARDTLIREKTTFKPIYESNFVTSLKNIVFLKFGEIIEIPVPSKLSDVYYGTSRAEEGKAEVRTRFALDIYHTITNPYSLKLLKNQEDTK